jgi:hypothetical protein
MAFGNMVALATCAGRRGEDEDGRSESAKVALGARNEFRGRNTVSEVAGAYKAIRGPPICDHKKSTVPRRL